LLIDFAGTRPATRFEGGVGSGKTTASKLITTTLYGESQHKKSTEAANYSDGARNPLLSLDNIETEQMTEELKTFMLTSITGIAREKRKGGSDTETIVERTRCLLNTQGVEPLAGQAEILSRTFIIRFEKQKRGNFLETKIVAEIKKNRDLIFSGLFKRTSQALAILREGGQERAMELLYKTLGDHEQSRANDYLALMYLMLLAGDTKEDIQRSLCSLRPEFAEMITSLNDTSREVARESNPIATCLGAVFKEYAYALEADRMGCTLKDGKSNVMLFRERYHLELENENTIQKVLARDLFVALKQISNKFKLPFRFNSVQQFVQRFTNDMDVIRQAGFEITTSQPRKKEPMVYDIFHK